MEKNKKEEVAVFGGGCFWCTEAVFKMLRGINSVMPGYAGGNPSAKLRASSPRSNPVEAPTYDEVSGGSSGYAEVIKIVFDPEAISFRNLLIVFFGSHDPTTRDRQGHDVGTQYRSIILYTTPEQKQEAERFIEELNDSNSKGSPVVTEIAPLDAFYEAESYHKNYYEQNKGNQYCEIIINPKLEKVQREFGELLKNNETK